MDVFKRVGGNMVRAVQDGTATDMLASKLGGVGKTALAVRDKLGDMTVSKATLRRRQMGRFVVNDQSGQGVESAALFARLGLTGANVNHFYLCFNEIDVDESGEVDLEEFYAYFGLKRSPFADRVFLMFDKDASGMINFEEFVSAVWNLCTCDTEGLVNFAFNLFDGDGSGGLDREEVKIMMLEIVGAEPNLDAREQAELRRALSKVGPGGREAVMEKVTLAKVDKWTKRLAPDAKGLVSKDAFVAFSERYPAALEPVNSLQYTLKVSIAAALGENFWMNLTAQRKSTMEALRNVAKRSLYPATPTVKGTIDLPATVSSAKDRAAKMSNSFIQYNDKGKAGGAGNAAGAGIKGGRRRGRTMGDAPKGSGGGAAEGGRGRYDSRTLESKQAGLEHGEAAARVKALQRTRGTFAAQQDKWKGEDEAAEEATASDPLFRVLAGESPGTLEARQKEVQQQRDEAWRLEQARFSQESAAIFSGRRNSKRPSLGESPASPKTSTRERRLSRETRPNISPLRGGRRRRTMSKGTTTQLLTKELYEKAKTKPPRWDGMGGPSHNDSLDQLLTRQVSIGRGEGEGGGEGGGVGGGEAAGGASPVRGAASMGMELGLEPSAGSRRRFRSGGARKHGAAYKVS